MIYEKTYTGTICTNENGTQVERHFEFTKDEIDKYIVLKFRYEEHMFCGGPFGTQLLFNHNKLSTQNNNMLYGVYRIEYHPNNKDITYKIKLTPVGSFGAWCPNRSWYTSDIESMINYEYNLFEENPVFDTETKAIAFALKKNDELYPDTRSWFKKIFDKIFK